MRDADVMVDALAGYEIGPDAARRAGAAAWARVPEARAVVLVEGVSDQIAVEVTARLLRRDLDGIVVLPINGAHAVGRTLAALRSSRRDLIVGGAVGGVFDVAEEPYVQEAVAALGYGDVGTRADLERLGFRLCVDDLEDELIRAAGADLVERVIVGSGERSAFAAFQAQPAWRNLSFERQARRFVGARSGRKHRYAAAFVEALGPGHAIAPLVEVLDHVASRAED